MTSISGGERSGLNVPVACFRARRLDPQYNNVFALGRNLNSFRKHLAETSLIRYHVIRRKQAQYGIRILPQQNESREADGRRGVTSDWFSDNLIGLQF